MKTRKEKLGKYIHQVDIRNSNHIDYLLGVSNEKNMIPSIANIVGTDLSSYKLVKNGQFVYGPVTSRNGEKISISLYQEDRDCIVSSSYIVFELNEDSEILAEFLYLWFKRPEFDRYSRYMSHGSVREIFSWESLCNVLVPVPSKEDQKEIIDNFKVIEKYINNIKKQNSLLTKYIDNKYLSMFSSNEKNSTIDKISKKVITGGTPSTENDKFWGGNIPFLTIPDMHNNCFQIVTERNITESGLNSKKTKELPINSIAVSCIGTGGLSVITTTKCITNQQINSIVCNDGISPYFVLTQIRNMQDEIINAGGGGTVGCNLSATEFKKMKIFVPSSTDEMQVFENDVIPFYKKLYSNQLKLLNLKQIYNLYLSKLAKI